MDTMAQRPGTSAHAAEPTDGPITFDELKMAYRCPGTPLEALRYDITPTGLHYQVVHFEIPSTSGTGWSLRIGGHVQRPVSLSLADLGAWDERTQPVTLECAGNGRALLSPRPVSAAWLGGGVSTASWSGVRLRDVLASAGPRDGAVEVVFSGTDEGIQGGERQVYARSLPLAVAMGPDVLLAYRMNGEPLPPQHGYPLRLVVPGWYGMASVKWLHRIEVLERPFEGFQNSVAYRYQSDADDPGRPVREMRVKSLMWLPSTVEFLSERRVLEAGPTTIVGRAWSGHGPVVKVEVAVDGVWRSARLDELDGHAATTAWQGWSFAWQADPGDHELWCRATDASGDIQPLEPPWNYQGMGNNAVQRLQVEVRR